MTSGNVFKSTLCSIDRPQNPGLPLVQLRDAQGNLRVAVLPQDGGGLASIRVRHRGKWREILYRGLDYATPAPHGWTGRAPLLFPALGRNFTPDQVARANATGRIPRACAYLHEGQKRSIRIHGFAMHVPWRLDSHGADGKAAWATCSLVDSPQTRKTYPFSFRLSVTHKLNNGAVTSRYELEAGDNSQDMPFGIGNHIGLVLPFAKAGCLDDCTVRTPGRKKLLLDSMVLLSGKSAPLDFRKPVAMRDCPSEIVIGGYTPENAWSEVSDPATFKVRISQREVPVGGRRLSRDRDILFVFWRNPGDGFLCPEPWLGWPNALNSGQGLLQLPPRRKFIWEMRLAVS
jgi:galactose mutarotase-like enzyme